MRLTWFVGLLAALLLPASALALDVGPPVGSRAPAIAAVDSEGKAATLASVAGKNGTVLVFFRSAAWCPYCQAQLIALKDAQAALAERGYTLVGISYDKPEVLAQFKARRGVEYTLLSDEGSKIIDAFNLRDPQYPPGHRAHGVPQPAIFVVSRSGVIQAKLAEEGYKNRPPVSVVIAAVDGVAKR